MKNANPEFTFTTDVIVGFPGETEEDFQETLSVMQEVQFAKVHLFPYSKRDRTRAALFPNSVSEQTIQERMARARKEAERSAFHLRNHYIGKKMTILTEESEGGHTENFIYVKVPGVTLEQNQICQVEIIANDPQGLIGRLL